MQNIWIRCRTLVPEVCLAPLSVSPAELNGTPSECNARFYIIAILTYSDLVRKLAKWRYENEWYRMSQKETEPKLTALPL